MENVKWKCFWQYLRSGAVRAKNWTFYVYLAIQIALPLTQGLLYFNRALSLKNYVKVSVMLRKNLVKAVYSQSPPPRTSACRPCCLCVPRWGTCPGTRCPYGDESCHCAAGAPPACPCRLLPVWGGVPGGGGHPGPPAKLHASWVFPSNKSLPLAHRALLWPPPSPRSHASEAERAAATRLLKREQTYRA